MKGLLALIKLTTNIPIKTNSDDSSEDIAGSTRFFPVIGIIIGFIMYLIFLILLRTDKNVFAFCAILIVVEVVITGGKCLESTAKVFSSIFKYRSKQKMLDNTKSDNIDAKGIISIVLCLLLRFALYYSIFVRYINFAPVLLAQVVSRLAGIVLCGLSDGARPTGLGKELADNTDKQDIIIAGAITLGVSILASIVFGFKLSSTIMVAIMSLAIPGFIGAGASIWMSKRIGGITYDIFNTVIEVTGLVWLMMF